MRIATVYDGMSESEGPYFSDTHAKIEDLDERARIVGFLRSGKMIMHTTFRDIDRIEPARGEVVSVSFRTDGQWVWSDAIAYYLDVHGLAPEAAFVQHMATAGYRAAEPDEAAIREAVEAVRPRRG